MTSNTLTVLAYVDMGSLLLKHNVTRLSCQFRDFCQTFKSITAKLGKWLKMVKYSSCVVCLSKIPIHNKIVKYRQCNSQ